MTNQTTSTQKQPSDLQGLFQTDARPRPPSQTQKERTPFYPESAMALTSELSQFDPVYLSQMQDVALLKRIEMKYVLPSIMLPFLLDALRENYRVLEVEGHRLNRYHTLYFDTPDFAMYRRHHNRAADRFKVRSRIYIESGAAFLEVKHKTNKRRVNKSRIETPALLTDLNDDTASFVRDACPYAADAMQPRLWNSYRRITLVNRAMSERVTLDIDLCFDWAGRSVGFPGLVVAEVKQERFSYTSDFIRLMRQHHIRSTGFSKYCIGTSLLYPDLKHNRFKAKHRLLAKLMHGEPHDLH